MKTANVYTRLSQDKQKKYVLVPNMIIAYAVVRK